MKVTLLTNSLNCVIVRVPWVSVISLFWEQLWLIMTFPMTHILISLSEPSRLKVILISAVTSVHYLSIWWISVVTCSYIECILFCSTYTSMHTARHLYATSHMQLRFRLVEITERSFCLSQVLSGIIIWD